jgi:signal transduction histidine kinase
MPVRWDANQNERMLRAANVTTQLIAVVLVGVFTFAVRSSGPRGLPVEIAAFTVSVVFIIFRNIADLAWPGRFSRLQPYGLGVIIVACGVASVARDGSNFIYLCVIASLAAGNGASLEAGWAVTLAGILAVVVAGTASGLGTWAVVGYCFLISAGFLIGLNRRSHRIQAEQTADLLAKSEQLRAEQATVATLEERTRIAREIHDVLAHSLGALGLNIQTIRAVLTDQEDVPRAVEMLDQAHRMAVDGLAETRRAVHALRGDMPPLPDGLAELSAEHQRRHGARVTFEVTGVPRRLPPDAGLAIARTAREALVNTAKHAPRQPVAIRLDYGDATTSLFVANRLVTGQLAAGSGLATLNAGYGLAGLRERLLLLDGTLTAGRDGDEWIVVAKVPR